MLKHFLCLATVVFLVFSFAGDISAQEEKTIYFFYGNGCPHCAVVEDYFVANNVFENYPIEVKEIYGNRSNALLYSQMAQQRGLNPDRLGVPAVVIGNKLIVGDRPIIDQFIELADAYLAEEQVLVEEKEELANFDLTLLAVIGASLVDAINPCAFAVLIILMSTILMSGNSQKALKAGLAFAASIFISYLLMGLGLYKALELGGVSGLFFKIVGWLALILGLLNLKDYFWYGKGFVMEVPMSWRPTMKSLIKSVSSPIGAFLVGFVVSLFLLPCTSGPYIVILGMLAKHPMNLQAISYLVLYNLIFVLPMVLITLAVYKGFDPQKAEKIRQKRLRLLHLIAGVIMLAMGSIILLGWV